MNPLHIETADGLSSDGDLFVPDMSAKRTLAVIEGEATLKRFFKKDGTITLKAENEKYAPITVSAGEFRIAGRVVGLLRKF